MSITSLSKQNVRMLSQGSVKNYSEDSRSQLSKNSSDDSRKRVIKSNTILVNKQKSISGLSEVREIGGIKNVITDEEAANIFDSLTLQNK